MPLTHTFGTWQAFPVVQHGWLLSPHGPGVVVVVVELVVVVTGQDEGSVQ